MISKINENLKEKICELNTIYVLKGFNSLVPKLKIEAEHVFDFGISQKIENVLNIDKKYMLKEFQKLQEDGNIYYCLDRKSVV